MTTHGRRKTPKSPKSCGKRRFRDEIAAKLALASIARIDSSKRYSEEQRCYPCPDCRGWHLTSKPIKRQKEER